MGYSSLDEYSNDFLNTLLISNQTYDYYVDWDKVFKNLESSLIEISILNSLNKVNPNELEKTFREILIHYPEVIKILPSIFAIRLKKVPIFNIERKTARIINFSDKSNLDEIIDFCIETGLLKLFNNIDDLYSYLVGTEVGLDTNARKYSSGKIFEVGRTGDHYYTFMTRLGNLVVYDGNNIVHTNDNNANDRYEISNKDSNFTLKYYKSDSLYSVLSGENVSGNYNYLYQVIDSKYNIKLTVNNLQYIKY